MEIDWLELWRELILANPHAPDSSSMKRYKIHAIKKQQRPDPLLEFILKSIDSNVTVLDIGAGDGRWAIPLARIARSVTAVEPDEDMLDILRENAKTEQLRIKVVQSYWEEADVVTHDIAVCAHAMYSATDLASFIRKMEQYARKACYTAIRLPPADGVIGELSKTIYGRLYDSANALVAYNALYSLGIYANILVENDIYHWVDDTLEEAFIRAKRHLKLESSSIYDKLIRETLSKRLLLSDNRFVWPDGMRSALLWWSPKTDTEQHGCT